MSTIAPKLPLSLDSDTTYKMMSTLRESTKQNFKCLVLTAPGERIMDPQYGCGLRRYLFEPASPVLEAKITAEIKTKASKYMPFISIGDIRYSFGDESSAGSANERYKLSLVIDYMIKPINVKDVINIEVNI